MQQVDLNEFTVEELEQLRLAIDEERIRRQHEERERILTDARDAAARYGMSVNKFLKSNGKKRRATASLKYRNPDNPKQVWSGRGKQPSWVQDTLAAGKSLDELADA